MANISNPFGMRPLGRREGGGCPEIRFYTTSVAQAQAICKWDPVTLLAGEINGPAGIRPGTSRYLGVVLTSTVPATSTATPSNPATLLVEVSPDSVFAIQGDGSGSGGRVISGQTINFNANLNLSRVAVDGGLRDSSRVQLSESTIAVDASLDATILSIFNEAFIAEDVGENEEGISSCLEVKFNKHLMNPKITRT